MNNTIRFEVGTKSSVEEVSSIINFEDLNICVELCLDYRMKVFENLAIVWFIFHKKCLASTNIRNHLTPEIFATLVGLPYIRS